MCALLAACAPRDRRTPDDTIVLLIEDRVVTLDPRCPTSNHDTKLSRLVAPGLVAMDTEDQRPRLELAEEIVQTAELQWQVTLRTDARFSDGSPVTAADVAWTYATLTTPGTDVFSKQFAERFTAVRATGPRTVVFELVAPLATFMTDIDIGILAEHANHARCQRGDVVGAGPYQVAAFDGDRVVLATNPHYHGPHPAVPRVDVRVVRDASARIVMLVGGSADLVQNSVRPDLVAEVAERERVDAVSAPSTLLTYLMFNTEDDILSKLPVRQAIALALDRPAIVDAMFQGRAVLATGLLAPTHWAYEPDVARWDHDPARAMRLLDEAGFPDPPGDAPRMTLVYKTSADQFRVSVAKVIAAQLREVGIAVEVRAFERATLLADLKRGAFDIATGQTSDIGEPDYYRTYFDSRRIPPKDPSGLNRSRYANPRIDELVEKGRRVVDLTERRAIYAEVQRTIAAELPWVALWHEDNVVLTHRDVVGYRILPNARFNGLVEAEKRQ